MAKPQTIGDIKIKDIKKAMLQLFIVSIVVILVFVVFTNYLYSATNKMFM